MDDKCMDGWLMDAIKMQIKEPMEDERMDRWLMDAIKMQMGADCKCRWIDNITQMREETLAPLRAIRKPDAAFGCYFGSGWIPEHLRVTELQR
jgi:hypothetical protein